MQSIQQTAVDVLPALLRRAPLSEGKIAFAWRAAVGAVLDRVARPSLGADGTLTVEVADARWQREIERSREIVLSRMRSFLGDETVKRLVIRGGHG